MSGGQQRTTTTTNNQPWQDAQPNLKTGLSDAMTLYQSGGAAPVNTMSTVVPDAQQTTAGLGQIEDNAMANIGGQGVSGFGQGLVDSGGFSAPQQRSLSYLDGAGTDPFDLSGNRAYQGYRKEALDDIQHRVNANASAAGRYGSAAHTGALVDELESAGTRMDLAQMGRMDGLNSQRFNAGQTGIGNVGTGYQMGNMAAGDLINTVGARYEDLAGRELNDRLRIEQEQATAPMRAIEWLNAVSSGAGQFGTTTQTAQAPGPSPWLQAAGLGLGGLGMMGGL